MLLRTRSLSTLLPPTLLVLLSFVGVASAQETSDEGLDDSTARSFYQAGVEAFSAGRFVAAYAAFEQGHELSGRPQFLFNMASSKDRLHESRVALELYERYLRALPDAENSTFVQRRIGFLREELASSDPVSPSGSAAPSPTAGPGTQPDESETSGFLSAPALISFGMGAAGLATFAVAGALSLAKFGDLDSTCAPICGEDEADGARTLALVADIGLGLGVAGLLVGLIFGLTLGDGEAETARPELALTKEQAFLSVTGSL